MTALMIVMPFPNHNSCLESMTWAFLPGTLTHLFPVVFGCFVDPHLHLDNPHGSWPMKLSRVRLFWCNGVGWAARLDRHFAPLTTYNTTILRGHFYSIVGMVYTCNAIHPQQDTLFTKKFKSSIRPSICMQSVHIALYFIDAWRCRQWFIYTF
jgi:hypothetical protein